MSTQALKNDFLFLFTLILFFFIPCLAKTQTASSTSVLAGNGQIIVTPTVIDQAGKPRDIFKYTIKIKNNQPSDQKQKTSLYAFVFNVYPQTGEMKLEQDSANIDRSTSLVSWIKFKRSVIELMPGAEVTLPLEIDISPTAKSGTYYGKIVLAAGSNRPLAKKKIFISQQPTIDLRIAVQKTIIEQAELEKFSAAKNVFFQTPIKFSLKIKNIGNQPVAPAGGLRIYNRRGQEVEMLYLEKKDIKPGASQTYILTWSPKRLLGRYRARLVVDYGNVYQKDLQDALYFWVLPWPFLFVFLVSLAIILVLLIAVIFNKQSLSQAKSSKANGIINLRQK